MGNTCVCTDEYNNKELSFKTADPENLNGLCRGNRNNLVNNNARNKEIPEGSLHDYGSKNTMADRTQVQNSNTKFEGNNEQSQHQPPSHIATAVTDMNPISALASGAISRLPQFKSNLISKNPVFGPLKYKSNGDTYKGQYLRGQKDGFGELTTTKGEGYVGEFRGDLKHGKGRLVFENGDLYEGEFKEGLAQGKGKFFNNQIGSVYEGDFKANNQNGKGKEIFKDGACYEGDFVNNAKTGQGMFVFADGSRFTGKFKNDQIEGRGNKLTKIYKHYFKRNC